MSPLTKKQLSEMMTIAQSHLDYSNQNHPDIKQNVHTCYTGFKNGDQRQGLAVVFEVKNKKKFSQCFSPIPRAFSDKYHHAIQTDVIESPIMSAVPPIQFYDPKYDPEYKPQSRDHQSCHNCPVPGGPQIQPQGANFVGTLGCCASYIGKDGQRHWGAITNWHVGHAGRFPVGTPINQPVSNNGQAIGTLAGWVPLHFNNQPNYVDLAIIDTARTDGPYAPLTHTVGPSQYKVGNLGNKPVLEPRLGDKVIKSGRTTGVTTGTVVGINAVSHVDYGNNGVARFEDQIVIKGDNGDFSRPGDSGSLILSRETLQPYGLLFAGGGGTTIANRISRVIDSYQLQFA